MSEQLTSSVDKLIAVLLAKKSVYKLVILNIMKILKQREQMKVETTETVF